MRDAGFGDGTRELHKDFLFLVGIELEIVVAAVVGGAAQLEGEPVLEDGRAEGQ